MASKAKDAGVGQKKKAPQPKKQAKGIRTWLGFVLDKSGSMSSQRDAAISGFNEFLSEQKKVKDDTRLTLTLFDTKVTTVYAAKPLSECAELTKREYNPDGYTALYDAVQTTTAAIEAQMGPGDRALITVFTDGQENSSKETTREQIVGMIAKLEAQGNWTFAYMGSHKEAWAAASSMGIRKGNFAQIDPNNVAGGARAMAVSTRGYRQSAVMDMNVAGSGLYEEDAAHLTAEDKAVLTANVKAAK